MSSPHLRTLPVEVILQVIDELYPADLERFAICNKVVYELCGPAVKIHQECKAKYSVLRFQSRRDLFTDFIRFAGAQPLALISEILQSPRLSYYPRELRLESTTPADIADDEQFNKVWREDLDTLEDLILEQKSQLTELATSNLWLPSDNKRADWCAAFLNPTKHVHHLAILMTLLPNLEIMTLCDRPWEIRTLLDSISAIAAANNDTKSLAHNKALTKLHKIAIAGNDEEPGEDLTRFAPFQALPSIRSLHGYRIGYERGESMVYNPLPYQDDASGNITEITMVESAIDVSSFTRMLSKIRALESLTYHHKGLSVGEARYEPAALVKELSIFAGHSLKILDLTCDYISLRDHQEHWQWVGSFNELRGLEYIRVDDLVFKQSHGRTASLVDNLPASIKSVRLVMECYHGRVGTIEERWRGLLVGLADENEKKLPKLREVAFEETVLTPSMQEEFQKFNDLGVFMHTAW